MNTPTPYVIRGDDPRTGERGLVIGEAEDSGGAMTALRTFEAEGYTNLRCNYEADKR